MISRFFSRRALQYLFWAILGAAVALLSLLRRGFDLIIFWADALMTAGGVLMLLGLLCFIVHLGAFDTFRFSFSALNPRRSDTLYDFTEARREKRKRNEGFFAPPLAVGAAYLLIGILLSLAV